jgi:hypothetical protein
MPRPRLLFLPASVIALLAIPALALAATISMSGTATGTATTLPPAPGATCNPPGATQPSDFICDSTVAGTFVLSGLGTGTYSGNVRLDWSIWTSADPCAEATGTITFVSGTDSITTVIEDTSRVCESTPASDTYTIETQSTATGGTGAFAAITAGTFEASGVLVATTPGEFTSTQAIVGSVTVADPVATVSPAPPSPAPATPAATAPAILPNTSTGAPAEGLTLVLLLGVLALASTAVMARRNSGVR